MTREWKVYSSDGKTVKATTKRVEYNGEYMGSCSLTVTFESPVPINFEIGDYINYRLERFYLNVVAIVEEAMLEKRFKECLCV